MNRYRSKPLTSIVPYKQWLQLLNWMFLLQYAHCMHREIVTKLKKVYQMFSTSFLHKWSYWAIPSMWLLWQIVKWKKLSPRLMWVGMKIGKGSQVFISAYELNSENSEVWGGDWRFWDWIKWVQMSFGWNECVIVLEDLNARIGNEV